MSDPRRCRLEADEAGLRRLVEESFGRIAIEQASGSPPTRYTIAFRCRGVVAVENGRAHFGEIHRVEVRLGARYPLAAPEVRFVTPVFHPHVFADGRVCLGFKTGITERLEDLVLRLGRLIQYDPELIDWQSPANREALRFAESLRASLPFGRETFRRRPPPRIDWNERSAR